jgi:hypothetical protein
VPQEYFIVSLPYYIKKSYTSVPEKFFPEQNQDLRILGALPTRLNKSPVGRGQAQYPG